MRPRHLGLAALAIIMATSLGAAAQKKPKRPPKKPKTQQPKDTAVPATRDTPAERPPPEPAPEPPKENEPAPPPRIEPPPPKPASAWLSRPLMVGVYGGYASENFRIGLGVRAGYSLLDTFYVGIAFTYHLGVVIGDATYRSFYPALEGGYDWHIDAITIRPYAGLGLTFAQVAGAGVSDTSSGFFTVYPGISADYQIANTPGFVGIDARLLVVLGGGDRSPSLGLFGVGGMRF